MGSTTEPEAMQSSPVGCLVSSRDLLISVFSSHYVPILVPQQWYYRHFYLGDPSSDSHGNTHVTEEMFCLAQEFEHLVPVGGAVWEGCGIFRGAKTHWRKWVIEGGPWGLKSQPQFPFTVCSDWEAARAASLLFLPSCLPCLGKMYPVEL